MVNIAQARRAAKKRILHVTIGAMFLCTFVSFAPQILFAQTVNCTVDKETIIRMRAPFEGNSGLWRVNFGDDQSDEHFVSGVALPDWEVIAVGGARIKAGVFKANSTTEGGAAPPMLELNTTSELGTVLALSPEPRLLLGLSKFNHRGRTIWSKTHIIDNLRSVVKILPFKDEYIVAANIGAAKTPAHIWLGRFDKDGALIAHRTITELRAHITATDIVAYDITGKNNKRKTAFALSATYQNAGNDFPAHARLYMVGDTLRTKTHRAFVTGTKNSINALHLDAAKNTILASGFAMGSDGRRNGWLLNLGVGGSIRWQKQYPRGASADIAAVKSYHGDTIITAGTSTPVNGGNAAGWVMRLDGNSGTPIWQRFFAGEMNYGIVDMRVNDDGVLSLVMNASAGKNAPQTDFVRLLNVSSGGLLIREDSYFNGEGARAAQVLSGPRGEHILIGDATVSFLKDNPDPNAAPDEEKITDQSNEGWIVVGRKAQSYTDPCLQIGVQAGIQKSGKE